LHCRRNNKINLILCEYYRNATGCLNTILCNWYLEIFDRFELLFISMNLHYEWVLSVSESLRWNPLYLFNLFPKRHILNGRFKYPRANVGMEFWIRFSLSLKVNPISSPVIPVHAIFLWRLVKPKVFFFIMMQIWKSITWILKKNSCM
jgi:hypothetical protein